MADFTMVAGGRRPSLRVQLTEDGLPFNLTDASGVTLEVGRSGTALGSLTCTIENAASGIVRLDWPASPALTAGTFTGQFKIDWGSSVYQHVPSHRSWVLEVRPES